MTILQEKLAKLSKRFHAVLQLRAKNLEWMQSKSAAFMGSSQLIYKRPTPEPSLFTPTASRGLQLTNSTPYGSGQTFGSQETYTYSSYNGGITQRKNATRSSSLLPTSFVPTSTVNRSNGGGGHQQAQLKLESQWNIGAGAMESVERTMIELQGIFQQFSSILADQGEQMQRIGSNIDQTWDNVDGAQHHLLKYMRNIQGNRSMIIKVFVVLLVCIGVWWAFCL
eukprot:TRINITY_DN7868_c0_g5_i2.p1 TRINITY_DN7868_c0_g5~~TRINITY_DN7868_c0_g5_i2.p1  ORF type:complete len:224 (+),score=32.13 TRINITY_DN7868_c0_g5_i2:647-1318(+)